MLAVRGSCPAGCLTKPRCTVEGRVVGLMRTQWAAATKETGRAVSSNVDPPTDVSILGARSPS